LKFIGGQALIYLELICQLKKEKVKVNSMARIVSVEVLIYRDYYIQYNTDILYNNNIIST